MSADDDRDTARKNIAERGLTPRAVAHLIADALGRIDLEQLAPVKGFLKRFFSDQPWTDADDRALADVVGPGEGRWTYDLDDDVRLAFGWRDDAFRIDAFRIGVRRPGDEPAFPSGRPGTASVTPVGEEAFASPITPEATPNPRTIRFVTGPIHTGPSRWYASDDQADDPRVARLFDAFADVANVLVGPDFVAVGLHRPDGWEALLLPVLRLVEAMFASDQPEGDAAEHRTHTSADDTVDVRAGGAPRATALDRAWRELSRLRPDDPEDLARIVAATSAPDVATRQAAARVLIDADPDVAAGAWRRLLDDSSRTVRRATVDVMVDAEREHLRSLLEHALHDADPWTRWKALHGLVNLGIEPSRAAVAALDTDPDFRVRLEAAGALRRA